MPRAKQRSENSARPALLGSAKALFAQRGFDGASTREIADRADVKQGLVRHHFGSKDALWREVVATGLGELGSAASHAGPDRADARLAFAAIWDGAFGGQRELLQVIVHALLEPGARRSWLIAQLRASEAVTAFLARVHAASGRESSAEQSELSAMRAIIVCAVPVLAAMWQALHGPAFDAATIALLQQEVWAGSHASKRVARAPGPWSLAAAEQRRAEAQLHSARIARGS